jgi:nucleotide-binding universal stress UspA family protein
MDHGVNAQSTVIATETTPAGELVRRLNERPRALILMGAFKESRLREWLSGSTTRTILQETRQPIVLFGH